MMDTELKNLYDRLSSNNSMAFSLRRIFLAATEGTVVTAGDFERWVHANIESNGLIEGKDYRYRENAEIDSIYIRGPVGLDMLLRANNANGIYVQCLIRADRNNQ